MKIYSSTTGLIKCRGCGNEDIKYELKLLDKSEYCKECGKLRSEEIYYFCSLNCLTKSLEH